MSARNIRYFALAYGIVFLLVGIAGFVPGLVTAPQPAADVAVEEGFGRLFGLFPVNVLHNVVHLAFGVWGLAAYRTLSAARVYFRSVAVIYAILAIMGLIPLLNTTFGLVPLYGHDVWLHVLLAVVAAYFGWTSVRPDEVRVGTPATSARSGREL
ncbi:MAG: hypothetical protein K0R41_1320 [Geminicoccaceae bacterium]|jgi:hypothetical protein|nr:hypothetical protein [Geminicoccaceae bacterium]